MFSVEHGIDSKNRTVHWQGDGSQLLTFSHLQDVAEFVHLVLSRFMSTSHTEYGRWYYIESFRASFDQIFAEAQRIDGSEKPWKIERSGVDEAARMQIDATAEGEAAWHLSLIHDGNGLRENNDNDEVGFTPKYGFQESVREALSISRA